MLYKIGVNTRYKISLETEHEEVNYLFHNLAAAKYRYAEILADYMQRGWRFSIAVYSGVIDRDGIFWHHRCIATFDYDGDASVLEAHNE